MGFQSDRQLCSGVTVHVVLNEMHLFVPQSFFILSFREAFPMVLVANKVDLVHLRKITSDQGQEMAAKHNVSTVLAQTRSGAA